MAFLIGTDEAGYGPNLGPLVIAATVWQVADTAIDDLDLYRQLAPLIEVQPSGLPDRLPIADSKRLYRGGPDLGLLEQAVLAALSVTRRLPTTWQELWDQLCPGARAELEEQPWFRGYNRSAPVQCEASAVARWAIALRGQCAAADVRLVQVRSCAVFPARFNREVERDGSKGTVLSTTTLGLVADIVRALPAEPVRVICDKHGGRSQYAGLLQPLFPERLIRVDGEGRRESRYMTIAAGRPVEFRFQAGGESFLPSALASMTAKYLRELAMQVWNTFWQREVAGLRPTAGYPVDARRFKAEIAATQARLGIDDRLLWRTR